MLDQLCIEIATGPFKRLERTFGAYTCAFNPIPELEEAGFHKITALADRVDGIARAAGLSEPIQVYTHEEGCFTGALGQNVLLINPKDQTRQEKELYFLLHHEIAGHMAHHDHIGELLYHVAYLIVDLIALYFCIPTIFLAEGFHFLVNVSVWQHREKRADLAAIAAMGSPEGALSYFQSCLDESGEISGFTKHPSYEERIRYCSSSPLPV